MTKGHFHAAVEYAEIYHCLAGEGVMVMENPEGEWSVAELRPGTVLYVAPRWAHRSVNTRLDVDLITFFAYPGHAGHDYGSIEKQGFRKLMVSAPATAMVDNPRWMPPEQRWRVEEKHFHDRSIAVVRIPGCVPAHTCLLFHRGNHRQVRHDAALPRCGPGTGPSRSCHQRGEHQVARSASSLSPGRRPDQIRPLVFGRVGHYPQDRLADSRPGYVRLSRSVRDPLRRSVVDFQAGRPAGGPRQGSDQLRPEPGRPGRGRLLRQDGRRGSVLRRGGSAVATALHLINKPNAADRPARFIVVNRSQGRLDSLREMVEGFEPISSSRPSATRTRRATM